MLVLSWLGTVLSLDSTTSMLIQADLWPPTANVTDLLLDLPARIEAPLASGALPGVTLEPGNAPRIIHFQRGGVYLQTSPHQRDVTFSAGRDDDLARFLLLSAVDAANLRDILGHDWFVDTWPILRTDIGLAPGFRLLIGTHTVELAASVPRAAPQPRGAFAIATKAGELVIHPPPVRPPEEVALDRLPSYRRPTLVATREMLREHSGHRMLIDSDEELLMQPLTMCDADRAWLYEKAYCGINPPTGRHRFRPSVVCERNKYVLLERGAEGVVFDETGASNETGYLLNLQPPMPLNFRRDGKRTFIARNALAAAPRLSGPHVMFYGGNFTNYFHWLIDAMAPLHVLAPYLPADTQLLLPATLRRLREQPGLCDHLAILDAFGFGTWPAAEIAAPLCHVEEVWWLDDGFIENLPAEALRGLRSRVVSGRSTPPRRRVYIRRNTYRGVRNTEQIEAITQKNGFETICPEDLSFQQQVDIFAQAEWVVASHGAGLTNILFCPPGAKVLELSPDCEYRPCFSMMCDKLGLSHGILPCPTDDGTFNGGLTVDIERFRALFRMMRLRQ